MFRRAFSALLISLSLAAPAVLVAWHAYSDTPGNTASSRRRARIVTLEDSDPQPAQSDDVEPAAELPADGSADSGPPLSAEMIRLRDQVRQVLAMYYQRPVNARDHSPWETFHWVLAYNVDAELYTRGPGGETANAVGWLCYNRPCRGQQLLKLEHGRPMGTYGVGLEGHTGQFLAILGQSRVMVDYPLLVKGRQFTVADLVENCQLSCTSGKDVELTFLLIGLSHYLHPDTLWKNRAGDTWSIPRLIREEISKPIRGAACGGTHRLMGLSYAVRKRQQHELPVNGEYLRAQAYVNDYIRYCLRMQNADGSLSTEWFTGPGARPDIDRRLQTTGHMLEWIVFSAADEQLADPQIVRAVDYVSRILVEGRDHEWKIGHIGHALRSISLYDRRMFKQHDPVVPEVASRDTVESLENAPVPPAAEENAVTPDVPAGNQTLEAGSADPQETDPPPAPSQESRSTLKIDL